jgi:geranylgeranyl diphosphate synthase type I
MIERYGEPIQNALRANLSHDHSFVYDMLRYYMGWADETGAPAAAKTGKAVRPTLCLFGCEAVGGSVDQAVPAAVALEFVHNFSLVHDDIQDEDEVRHSRKTIWAVWGKPKALVAGNVLRVVADTSLQGLIGAGLDSDRALTSVNLLTESYLEMIEGQYLDLSFEGRHDIDMDDYRRMISRKTGALIRCSLNLGAAVGTDDQATVTAFRECGRALGYVFQIRDDVLGVWGEEEVTGKPVGADIRRKKNSYPIVYAMAAAEGADSETIASIYQKSDLDDEDIDSVLRIMDRVGVREHAMAEAREWADSAVQALAPVELSPAARREIEDFVHFLMVRDR